MKGQSAALTLNNNQIQVLITGKFGDGSLHTQPSNKSAYYSTCCVYKEYLEFKQKLLGNLCAPKGITSAINLGFKKHNIYRFSTISTKEILDIKNESLEDSLNKMNELGLALWFYDDGALHKDKYFYNLNTQAYPESMQRDLFVPFLLQKFNIKAIPTIERKKDGRQFWYLRVGRWDGSELITEILRKYPVNCYSYKCWSSETIQKWSKLQEQLKSSGIDYRLLHARTVTTMFNKISI